MTFALRVESVSKCFRVQRDRPSTVKESFVWRLTGRRSREEVLWALKDVSFTVEKGRCLGIIGHNGAGKSTLLRLLCGVGHPTSGSIHREGYVSGLLELGSGWHHEMTGRENILTAGILNGLTKRQVQLQQKEIIAFAELEDFIDRPVRTYSSGMYLRLAFSTAIHFDPDVLMIDEVLAVGDSRFQQKCTDRLNSFRKAGKTLLLVSHNTDQIRSLCDEVVVLEEGELEVQTDPESAMKCYNDLMRLRTERRSAQLPEGGTDIHSLAGQGSRVGTQEAVITDVRLCDSVGRFLDHLISGEGLKVILEYRLKKSIPDMAFTLGVFNETNVKCFEITVSSTYSQFGLLGDQGSLTCYLPNLYLLPGRYYINVGFYPLDWSYVYDFHWQMHPLQVESREEKGPGLSGIISVRPTWSVHPGHGENTITPGAVR
jgi:lipopolysaccharide transport system ATP-binding protein